MSDIEHESKTGGYDPSFYKKLEHTQDVHFWFRARRAAVTATLRRFEHLLPKTPRLLELGCGNGDLLRILTLTFGNEAVVGMDMHCEGLAYAARRVQCLLLRGRAESPPFAIPFDLVAMFDVLEHIEDDQGTLRQVNRLVSPGGFLVLTVPADPKLWSYFDEASHHCRRYDLSQLEERLNSAGFSVEYLTPYMQATYPLLRLGRLVRGIFSGKRQTASDLSKSDLKVWPVLNGMLTFLLQREARRIEQGRRLRKGSSLLAVARKK